MSFVRFQTPARRSAPRALLLAIGLSTLAFGVLSWSSPANAEVIVYAPGPPPTPPPPPPPPGYYYRPRRAYVYEEREHESEWAFQLGFDLEGAAPLNVPRFIDGNRLQGGGGVKLRLGEQVRLAEGIRFTLEGGYGYDHLFAEDDTGNAYSWNLHRLFGGARIGFGRFVVPTLYAHAGYGWRDTDDPTVAGSGGFAFDVGGALDFHLVPHFGIGAHLEYASIDAEPYAPSWTAFGLHADIVF